MLTLLTWEMQSSVSPVHQCLTCDYYIYTWSRRRVIDTGKLHCNLSSKTHISSCYSIFSLAILAIFIFHCTTPCFVGPTGWCFVDDVIIMKYINPPYISSS